jgi:hypothetical protein
MALLISLKGCMLNRISGGWAHPAAEKLIIQTPEKQTIPRHDACQQTIAPTLPTPTSTSTSMGGEIPTSMVTFLWKQMVIIRQHAQELQLLVNSPIESFPDAYAKLIQVNSILQPILLVLDGMIASQRSKGLHSEKLRIYRLAIEKAIKRVQAQIFDHIDQYNDIKYSHLVSVPDPAEELVYETIGSAEKYVHIRLDRQLVTEELAEIQEDMEILDERLHVKMDEDNSNEFSGQLDTQVAILEHGIEQAKIKCELAKKKVEEAKSILKEESLIALATEEEKIVAPTGDFYDETADEGVHSTVLEDGIGPQISYDALGLQMTSNEVEPPAPSPSLELSTIIDSLPLEDTSKEQISSPSSDSPSIIDSSLLQTTTSDSAIDGYGHEADISHSLEEPSVAADELKSSDDQGTQSPTPGITDSWAVIPQPAKSQSAIREAAAILDVPQERLGATVRI